LGAPVPSDPANSFRPSENVISRAFIVSPCRFLRCCGGHHRDGTEQRQSRFAHAQ